MQWRLKDEGVDGMKTKVGSISASAAALCKLMIGGLNVLGSENPTSTGPCFL